MNGLLRYNEIQKALSSFRKDSGIKFKASFQKTASQIYHNTVNDPLKGIIQNIDIQYENIIPELSPELQDWTPFFNYDLKNKNGLGVVDSAFFPDNLKVKSPQLHGPNFIAGSSDVDYNSLFKDFSDYANANIDIFWSNSDDAPRFRFGDIDFDPVEDCYYTTLEIDRDDAYGYEPGIGGVQNEAIQPTSVIEEEEIPEEAPEPEEKPKTEDAELEKIKAETEKTKAETEKIKASSKKLEELNKAVENLDKMFDRGLISKTEYKKYLKNIYSL
jgi:hypothetical protein